MEDPPACYTENDVAEEEKEIIENYSNHALKDTATSSKDFELVGNGGCSLKCFKDEDVGSENSHISEDEIDEAEVRKKEEKINEIQSALQRNKLEDLFCAAISERGLISDCMRQVTWPKLAGVDVFATSVRPTMEEVQSHPYYEQVLLDVNRSLKRFPPSIKEKQRLAMQDQLVLLIMRFLVKHPTYHYYQGYHDICVTFLLVLGEELSFHVVEKISTGHLEIFMRKTMEPTMEMLYYMYPIISKENAKLYGFLDKSDVGVMFALSWVITWFGHVLNKYSDVVRLFDFFMASNKWMPVYLSASIVLYREAEILKQDCDMASVHSLLLNLPIDLPFEKLISKSMNLFQRYPPDTLEEIVKKQLQKKKEEMAMVKRRPPTNIGILGFMFRTIKYIRPTKKITWSIVIATAVVVTAVIYQSYKTRYK